MSLYREKPIKKTRSPHFCHGCGLNIPRGSPALYIVSQSEDVGVLFTGYLCQTCERIWKSCSIMRAEYPDRFGEEDIKNRCENCEQYDACNKFKEDSQ